MSSMQQSGNINPSLKLYGVVDDTNVKTIESYDRSLQLGSFLLSDYKCK